LPNNSLLRRGRLALASLTVAAAAVAVSAFDIIREGGFPVKWQDGTVFFSIKVGTGRTLQDGTNFSTSFIAAMDTWNGVVGSIQLSGNIDAEGLGGRQNGVNEVFFGPDVYGTAFDTQTIAVTTSFRSSVLTNGTYYRRTQSDIVFNNSRNWDSYRGATQTGVIDFRRVALHELGHVLGLDHPDQATPVQTVTAVMNSRVSSIDSLQADDIAGAQSLYGAPTSVTRPANNDFANATTVTLTNNAATVTGRNNFATKQQGEPNHAPNEAGGASVWWRLVAPASGSLNVTTAGSTFDTLLGAYTGNAVDALSQLASNDDVQAGVIRTSTITFNVTGGTTYFFAVDGWEGEWGNVTLNFSLTPSAPSAPVITAQPQNVTTTIGGTASFSVTANGNPAPTYQWARNGTAIAGATASTLSLTNVQTADAGNYSVTVSNSSGSATSSTATLTVNGIAPTITAQPQSQTVTTGSNVTFSVTATGNPTPTYQWSKGGVAISGATGTSLALTNVQTGDAGTYTVTVTNSAGNVTSTAATLTVNSPVIPPSTGGGGGGGGGGGAPSAWFALVAAAAAVARAWRRRAPHD
jgi:uncharacterized repeat protein (TIGR01451 family)